MVRMTGVEPARSYEHEGLNLARLPITPHPHVVLQVGLEPTRHEDTMF